MDDTPEAAWYLAHLLHGVDPEGLKRCLDERAAELEETLSRPLKPVSTPAQNAFGHAVLAAELALTRELFQAIGR